jgi:hypothetical protein
LKPSAIASAEKYLREQLADGPKLFRDLLNASNGIHERTLERAGQRLAVVRSRASASGPWVWRLNQADHLFPPSPPVAEAEYLPPPLAAPDPDVCTVDHLLTLAESLGLHWPLSVAIRSPDGRWSIRVCPVMESEPEVIVGDFTPDPTVPPDYASVKQWDTTICRGQPPALVLDHGQLWLMDNRGRRLLHLATITK